MYLSCLLTLELCAEIHKGPDAGQKVKHCAARLLPRLRSSEQVMRIFFSITQSPKPLGTLQLIRSMLDDTFGGHVTVED